MSNKLRNDGAVPLQPDEQPSSSIHFGDKKAKEIDDVEYELRKRLPPRFLTRKCDIYITNKTNIKAQLARCQKLMDQGVDPIFIHGLGTAINRSINLALRLKRRGAGALELDVQTSTVDVTDDLTPTLGDSGHVGSRQRHVSAVHVKLFVAAKPADHV